LPGCEGGLDSGGRERKEMNKKQINICIAAVVMFVICSISNTKGFHLPPLSSGAVGYISFDLKTTLFEWAAMAIVFGTFFFFCKTPNENG
jgi:hypothetical protein